MSLGWELKGSERLFVCGDEIPAEPVWNMCSKEQDSVSQHGPKILGEFLMVA